MEKNDKKRLGKPTIIKKISEVLICYNFLKNI